MRVLVHIAAATLARFDTFLVLSSGGTEWFVLVFEAWFTQLRHKLNAIHIRALLKLKY